MAKKNTGRRNRTTLTTNTVTTIIIIIAALALVFGIIEIFFMPGFGVAGIVSIVCALIDTVLIYQCFGLGWAVAAVTAGVALLAVALRWVAKSKTFDRMALHTSIDSTAATQAQLSVKAGDLGTAVTRLALVGNAEIDGNIVEVKSSGDFLNPGTPVRVVSVCEANITVERVKE